MTLDPSVRERILAAVDADAAVRFLQAAIAVPSVTGAEGEFGRFVRHALEERGLETFSADFLPDRPVVWGIRRGAAPDSADARRLMFLGHLDTVHVTGWSERWAGTERESPFSGALVDGEVWGRGAGDEKAGIIAVIAALDALAAAGLRPKADVVGVFVGDEESGEAGSGYSDGMKKAVELVRDGSIPSADFAIYTEPTTLHVCTAQMGFLTADITVEGVSAYFGTPWLGVDALRAAHDLLTDLWAYNDAIWARGEHQVLGRAFVLATGITGGGYIAVPERVRISLIRKILPSETLDAVRGELDDLLRRFSIRRGIRATIEYTAPRDHAVGGTPAEVSRDLPAVRELERIVREVTGKADAFAGAPYWSEMSFLINALGIPAVYCSPGDITNCHTAFERVRVDELDAGVRAFALFIAEFCGVEGTVATVRPGPAAAGNKEER